MARFKELRIKKGLTQEELITQFNDRYGKRYGASSISMFENNKRIPETQALMDFADFFNVSVDYLLGRTDQPQGTGFQKGLLGDADSLAQKAREANENASFGLSIQGDLVKIDEIDVHLHPKSAEKVKKAIELALHDEIKAAKEKAQLLKKLSPADKKWELIKKTLTKDIGVNCLRLRKNPEGDTGDFVCFSENPLSLDEEGNVEWGSGHEHWRDLISLYKELSPIINAKPDEKQKKINAFIKKNLSFELAIQNGAPYVSKHILMGNFSPEAVDRWLKSQGYERIKSPEEEDTPPAPQKKAN